MKLRKILETLAEMPVIPGCLVLGSGKSPPISIEELLSGTWKIGVDFGVNRELVLTDDRKVFDRQLDELTGREVSPVKKETLLELLGEPSGVTDRGAAIVNATLTEAVQTLKNIRTTKRMSRLFNNLSEEK